MDYKNISIPFLDSSVIKNRADSFRLKFWDESLPVDIEKIIDLKLKIDIITVLGLQDFCDTDALISSNWNSIYVDYRRFLDERYQNRLRFSFAHEIGHFVLHKDIYKAFKIKDKKDFYRLIKEIPQIQYGYLEVQANKFANNLLIPREILTKERKRIENGVEIKKIIASGKVDKKTINSYISIPLAKIFMVSEDAIEIALNDINNDL
jgi:Zn-dependent peptidase ImmA (M78 family)